MGTSERIQVAGPPPSALVRPSWGEVDPAGRRPSQRGTRYLYVHIPFCRSRCAYCDFASEAVGPHARAGRVDRYLEAVRAELASHLSEAREGPSAAAPKPRSGDPSSGPFETVYIGGGTPTVLPEGGLLDLVGNLASALDGPNAELTIEANPGTFDSRLLEGLRQAGATRLSLGVQSFSPRLRSALGRTVTQHEIERALAAIAETGWDDWNLDLIFGIPGQTWSDVSADLEAAVAARPTHISLYDLTYTAAYAGRVERECGPGARARAASWAERHYSRAVAGLERAGYARYEVSNFALPGHECRHNQAYWRGEDYLGIGAAAVSTVRTERRTNPVSVVDYLAGSPGRLEVLSARTRLWEKAMLGLRTSLGVDDTEVSSVLDLAARDRLLSRGCLERRCGKLRLNPGFLDISNAVISTLLVSPEGSQPT